MAGPVSKFALVITGASILFLVVTQLLHPLVPVAVAVELLAVGLSVWARRSFPGGQFSIGAEPLPGPLLSRGPYRFIRHPMYATALLILWASVLSRVTPVSLGLGLVVSAVIATRIAVEETFLVERIPDYAAYARRTKRLIPLVL